MNKKIDKNKKDYQAWLDISISDIISQPMQRILFNEYANRINGKIIFELGEDVEFKSYNLQLRNLIKNKIKVNGFIFLRLEQFILNSQLNIKIIQEIIKKNYELHFIKQDLSFTKLTDLKKNINNLIIFNDIKKM